MNKEKKIIRANRLGWTQEETQFVKYMKEDMNEKSWTVISKQLHKIFPHKQRTSKQCRELYINSVKLTEKKGEWTRQEIKILIDSFGVHGPKWILISQFLPGRSENCIKNKFYGSLRKMVRRVNEVMRCHSKKSQRKMKKPIKFQSIMKIFDLSHLGFQIAGQDNKLNQLTNLKNYLLNIVASRIEQISEQELINLAQRIYHFNCKTRFLGPAKNKMTNGLRKINRCSNDGKKIFHDPITINQVEQHQNPKDLSTQKTFNNFSDQFQHQNEQFWSLEEPKSQIILANRLYEEQQENLMKQIFDIPEQNQYYLLFG